MKIVETDNFGGDYPDEKFVNLPRVNINEAESLCSLINEIFCADDHAPRFWKMVEDDYKLIPGFEP